MNLLVVFVCVCSHLFTYWQVAAQECLQARGNNGSLPVLEEYGNVFDRIHHRHQAIVASYQFQCCGNVTEWGADVPGAGGDERKYTIAFQVWRPSPTVESDGCYSLVGENRFTSVSIIINDFLILETPLPEEQISFQPKDVVGFYIESSAANPGVRGVILDTLYDNETVWYANIDEGVTGPTSCPYPVGTESDRFLRSSTNAAPVLFAQTATGSCPPLIIPTTSSQPSHNPTITTTLLPSPRHTLTPSPSTPSPKTTDGKSTNLVAPLTRVISPPLTPSPPSPNTPLTPSTPSPPSPITTLTPSTPSPATDSTLNDTGPTRVVLGILISMIVMVMVVIATIVGVACVISKHYTCVRKVKQQNGKWDNVTNSAYNIRNPLTTNFDPNTDNTAAAMIPMVPLRVTQRTTEETTIGQHQNGHHHVESSENQVFVPTAEDHDYMSISGTHIHTEQNVSYASNSTQKKEADTESIDTTENIAYSGRHSNSVSCDDDHHGNGEEKEDQYDYI